MYKLILLIAVFYRCAKGLKCNTFILFSKLSLQNKHSDSIRELAIVCLLTINN